MFRGMENLQSYLSRTGMTQAQFAALIDVTQGQLSKIIQKRSTSLKTALKIEAATGGAVTVASLTGEVSQ